MTNLFPGNYRLTSDLFILVSEYDEFFYDFDPYGLTRGSEEYIRGIYTMLTDLANGIVDPYIEPIQDIQYENSDDEDIFHSTSELIDSLTKFKLDYAKYKGEHHES